ncbi:MAG: glycosyltransferase family 117 protein [Longimicrobiales bacterium]
MSGWSDRIVAAFVMAYPPRLRAEYGRDLRQLIQDLGGRTEYGGWLGRTRLGLFLCRDVVQSIARERVAALGTRTVPQYARRRRLDQPPFADALLAALVVFAVYVATLAPTVAFWDSGEYLTAAHVLGIPHQPGNPLFVMLAHLWEAMLSPLGLSPAVRLNLFSAMLSAGAHFFWYLFVYRVSQAWSDDLWVRRISGGVAVLLSATAFTVWNQSNVNEKVYTLSLFTIAMVSWLLLRWRDKGCPDRGLLLIVFLLALTSTNHLMGVLAAPAVCAYVLLVKGSVLLRKRLWALALVCVAVGLTPNFFLPVRAAQRPILNEADPSCASLSEAATSIYTWGRSGCPALSASLRREQYGKPPITLDPTTYPQQQRPRGSHLLAAQLANYAQYFNWQWARGVGGSGELVGGLRPLLTLVFLLLGVLGARTHWRRERASATYLGVLFLTLSIGLVLYLNFEFGFAMARNTVPDPQMHEVRERDYFFLISFSVWALWAGLGVTELWQRLTGRLKGRVQRARWAAAPVFAVALLPLGLNWQWASRAGDYTARDWAYNVLMSVQPYGVLFTNGDNDTFPLWYLQEVEGIRRDVTVMVTGYLNTSWYARQVRDLTRPCARAQDPAAAPNRIVCQRAYQRAHMPLPLRLAAPGPPKDSILPLSDASIDEIAGTYYVLRDPITFRAGGIQTTLPAGTEILPADTFVAAIVQATLGERPIHFTAPAPAAQKLGLFEHTVRRGLTFQLRADGAAAVAEIITMPRSDLSAVLGAHIDLDSTTLLMERVFQQRGRVLDPSLPWVDRATTNILLQYSWAHYAAAQAYAARGEHDSAARHAEQAEWWQRRAD